MNTTILKGVHIGNNVIIGAGSLVNSDIPNNTVAAGNPARVIMSLEQYYAKRLKAQEAEAVELVKKYRERNNGKNPSTQDLSEFFWLFSDKDDILDPSWKHKMSLVGNEKYSYSVLEKNKKMFSDMNEFLNSIKR